jgi:hypothetical protein
MWWYTKPRGGTRNLVVVHEILVVVHETSWWYTKSRGGTRNLVVVHEILWWYTKSRGGTQNLVVVHETSWWYTKSRGGTRNCSWWYTKSRGGTRNLVVVHEISWWYTKSRGGTRNLVVVHETSWWYTKPRGGTRNLVVVHEITMAAAVTNLKRLLAICGDRKVFIITHCLRYANTSCCTTTGHCVHHQIPDFAFRLLEDLRRLHSFFKQRLSSFANCTVIPVGDLMAGKKDASNSDIIAAYSGWGSVHGYGTSYTRMALYLLDNLFRVPIAKPAPPLQQGEEAAQ